MGGEAMLQHRDLVRLWSAILGRLEFDVRPHQFRTWLKPTRALGLEGATLLVEAPSSFACDWLTEQLGPAVVDAVAEAAGPVTSVRFVPRRAADIDCPFEGARIAARVTAAPGPIGTIAREFTFDRYLVGEGNRVAVSSCHELIDSEKLDINDIQFMRVLKSNVGAFLDFETTSKALLAITSSIDVFDIWGFLVGSIALSKTTRFSKAGAMYTVGGVWMVYILLKVALGAVYTAFLG